MNSSIQAEHFSHTELPSVGKRVLRMGIAGNYGLQTADIHHAAERGANLWLWTPRFRAVTPAVRAIVPPARDRHVVVMLGVAYTAGMVRRGVEKALRQLGVDHLDYYLLSWLGTGSALTQGVQDTMVALRDEGKVTAIGTSIHDRPRAGRLAADSVLDALMVRYNAKHPGAEQDIFPHVGARPLTVFSYTTTSWRQLITPVAGIEMPPFPGHTEQPVPPLTPGLCYRFVLSNPHVHVAYTGPKDRAQLDANLDALAQGPLTDEEEAWVREYGRQVKARKRFPYL